MRLTPRRESRIWRYDPKIRDRLALQHLTCRGLSYSPGGGGAPAGSAGAAPAPRPNPVPDLPVAAEGGPTATCTAKLFMPTRRRTGDRARSGQRRRMRQFRRRHRTDQPVVGHAQCEAGRLLFHVARHGHPRPHHRRRHRARQCVKPRAVRCRARLRHLHRRPRVELGTTGETGGDRAGFHPARPTRPTHPTHGRS